MRIRTLLALLFFAVIFQFNIPLSALAESSAILEWAKVDKPDPEGNVIVSPSEVSRIAVGRTRTVYAIDSVNNKVYRSRNEGSTWTDINKGLVDAGAVLPASEIAANPFTSQVVTVVTNGGTKVYMSKDGGDEWIDTNVPVLSGTIQCIAISKPYSIIGGLSYDMAIGTASWGNGTTTGQVWVRQFGGQSSSWQNQNIIVDPTVQAAEVSAITFSPNYKSDETILAIASTAADVAPAYQNKTWLCIGRRDIALQSTEWNDSPGFPVEITGSAGDAGGVSKIISSLALPRDYSGTNTTDRIAFMSYDRQPSAADANDDVYRISDTSVFRMNANTGNNIDISSISYSGTIADGKLLAGDTNPATTYTVQVRRTFHPLSSFPSWLLANQPPTGPGNAQVFWNRQGTVAYCGTGQNPGVQYDESAFSRSIDEGDTWGQVSLIDTIINVSDIAPAPNSKSLFLATYSDFGPEGVWLSKTEPLGEQWTRVLTTNTTLERLIIGLSPSYNKDRTIYVAEVGGTKMHVSNNKGSKWKQRVMPGPMIDIAIKDKETIYIALPNGRIRKSLNSGVRWQNPSSIGLLNINMIMIAENGHIFIGSRDGRVAYSSNDGASFVEITKSIRSGTGDVQVIVDSNYDNNRIIYAATNVADEGIWRWVIGSSTQWEQIDEVVTKLGLGQSISGLAIGDEGTLYALRSEIVDGFGAGGAVRSLNPTANSIVIEFDILNATLPVNTRFDPNLVFPNTLPALKLSGTADSNNLWGVDTNNHIIYRFQDNICKAGPMTTPADVVGCDTVTGRNQSFAVIWEQISLSLQHQIQWAKEDAFRLMLFTSTFYEPVNVLSPTYSINNTAELECGHTYYWRIRTRKAATGEIIRSPWSNVGRTTIKAGFKVTTPYYGPQLLAPDDGCGCPCEGPFCFSWSPFKETQQYKIQLSENADMSSPLISKTVDTTAYQYDGALKCNTNYFWRVMAIKPAPSEWSTVFSFMTRAEEKSQLPPSSRPTKKTPVWVWIIFDIGLLLMTVTIVLIAKDLFRRT
jgi:hypothetical protein